MNLVAASLIRSRSRHAYAESWSTDRRADEYEGDLHAEAFQRKVLHFTHRRAARVPDGQALNEFVRKKNALFLGRGTHYPIALEGPLQPKEIAMFTMAMPTPLSSSSRGLARSSRRRCRSSRSRQAMRCSKT